jgi:hypothetical protein
MPAPQERQPRSLSHVHVLWNRLPPGANTVSGNCFDVLLDAGLLAPGNYQIALPAFENMSFAENTGADKLADGFTGLGNLARGEDLHYAFDVDLTSINAVPEPATGILAAVSSLALCLYNRKYKGEIHEE